MFHNMLNEDVAQTPPKIILGIDIKQIKTVP